MNDGANEGHCTISMSSVCIGMFEARGLGLVLGMHCSVEQYRKTEREGE